MMNLAIAMMKMAHEENPHKERLGKLARDLSMKNGVYFIRLAVASGFPWMATSEDVAAPNFADPSKWIQGDDALFREVAESNGPIWLDSPEMRERFALWREMEERSGMPLLGVPVCLGGGEKGGIVLFGAHRDSGRLDPKRRRMIARKAEKLADEFHRFILDDIGLGRMMSDLSLRDVFLLNMLATDMKVEAIATQKGDSRRKIDMDIKSTRERMGVSSKVAAVAGAVQIGVASTRKKKPSIELGSDADSDDQAPQEGEEMGNPDREEDRREAFLERLRGFFLSSDNPEGEYAATQDLVKTTRKMGFGEAIYCFSSILQVYPRWIDTIIGPEWRLEYADRGYGVRDVMITSLCHANGAMWLDRRHDAGAFPVWRTACEKFGFPKPTIGVSMPGEGGVKGVMIIFEGDDDMMRASRDERMEILRRVQMEATRYHERFLSRLGLGSHRVNLGLTAAEIEVMRRLAEGADIAQISRERGKSLRTIEKQVYDVRRKLGATTSGAVARLVESGAIFLPGEWADPEPESR